LFLLPGHIRLAEYEVTLGIAQELSAAIQALQNLPGALAYLLERTADSYKADYVLIDMSPGLGPINQNLFSTADYFLVPTSPDFFSVMAIDSLARIIPRWQRWAQQAYALEILREAAYPFPKPHSRFVGTVVQNFRPRRGVPAKAFKRWIDEITERVRTVLLPELAAAGMLLADDDYQRAGIHEDYRLAMIADFNSLIAKSQTAQTPVFALSEAQLGQGGTVLEQTKRSRGQFESQFSDLADRVVALTDASVA
jgi:cellulose biosynthesis protein BcsQ